MFPQISKKNASVLPRALLTSVNQKDPDGAYELLQSAKLIEQRQQGPNQDDSGRFSTLEFEPLLFFGALNLEGRFKYA